MEMFICMILFFTFISVIFTLFVRCIDTDEEGADNCSNPEKNAEAQNYTQHALNESIKSMINAENINNIAHEAKIKMNMNKLESVYYSISSLITFINSHPQINKTAAMNEVYSVTTKNYPELLDLIKNYNEEFDLLSHIILNAKILEVKERKSRREALYLTICTFYDDLVNRNSKSGIWELIEIVKVIYPDIIGELAIYSAWKYHPEIQFNSALDAKLTRRHAF